MVKIKKFRKPLLEDDAQAQVPAAAPQQSAVPANNTAQPAAAPQQQNTAPNAQQQNVQQQNGQQQNGQQQNDPNAQQQPNPNTEKVSNFLEQLASGDGFWGYSVNIPEEIQKQMPDFKKGNTLAEPAIAAWEKFKAQPSKDTYAAFIDAFKVFGGVDQNAQQNNGQQPQQNNTQQPAAPVNNAQQPAAQPQAVNAGMKAAYSFQKNLMENLAIAKRKNYYNSVVEDYFDKTEFTL